MSKKTIAKFFAFVILTAISLLIAACSEIKTTSSSGAGKYGSPEIVGKIESPEIDESSGIAASKCQRDVFWTHNDSGGLAAVYAFNREGDNLGTWTLAHAENRDWEDIATWKDKAGRCFIYIGELGDNKRASAQHIVFRIQEPSVLSGGASPSERAEIAAEQIRFMYPDGDHDAEALMVHPQSGDIFVMTKNESGPTGVYRINADFNLSPSHPAEKVADISLPSIPNGLVTGADISPDGRRVVVCDYRQAYELELPGAQTNFSEIWKQKPTPIDIGRRKTGEAICYSMDGSEILATSEGKNPPIISVRRLK
jgi:hypothetical protein